MRTEFIGSIAAVRDLEDCIRATKKYTKGAFSSPAKHPIQGEEFPSKMLTEYYEVYPDLELDWDMSATDAWAWVWGDVAHIDVLFRYNYNNNKARVVVRGGNGVVDLLKEGITNFSELLEKILQNGLEDE